MTNDLVNISRSNTSDVLEVKREARSEDKSEVGPRLGR